MFEYSSKNIMSLTRLGMRKSFGKVMTELVRENDDVIILAADVASSSGLNEFKEKYPDKFYNIGIAEQNMIAIATGLAKEGSNVFVVSFAPFVSLRVFEAIRTLVGYMNLNIKIVSLASGMSLGIQGYSHYCLEDIALMNTIPNMKIFSPADCCEMSKCLEFLLEDNGPAYLRLTGIDGSMGVYKQDYEFDSNEHRNLKDGNDVLILATGSVVAECVRATRALKKEDISCGVMDVCCIKPLNEDSLWNGIKDYKLVLTVEEHSIIGGLGSIVSNVFVKHEKHPKLIKLAIPNEYISAGNYSYLLNKYGLTAENIKNIILDEIKGYKGEN